MGTASEPQAQAERGRGAGAQRRLERATSSRLADGQRTTGWSTSASGRHGPDALERGRLRVGGQPFEDVERARAQPAPEPRRAETRAGRSSSESTSGAQPWRRAQRRRREREAPSGGAWTGPPWPKRRTAASTTAPPLHSGERPRGRRRGRAVGIGMRGSFGRGPGLAVVGPGLDAPGDFRRKWISVEARGRPGMFMSPWPDASSSSCNTPR